MDRKKKRRLRGLVDLHKLPEDERIQVIGESVLKHKITVAVCVDADPPAKADRYIAKLLNKFPTLVILERLPGPTPGAYTIKIGPPVSDQS